jgi:glycosyltransferase involved in cell wall biosynthesis
MSVDLAADGYTPWADWRSNKNPFGAVPCAIAAGRPRTDDGDMPDSPTPLRPNRLCVYTRSWRRAGAGLFAQELVGGMVAAGAAVTYISPPTPNPAVEAPQPGLTRLRPPRELAAGASRLRRAAISLARMAGGVLSLLRARLSCRVFVVTIPDPLVVSVPALALLRLSGARIIFIAHDPLPHAWRLPPALRGAEVAIHGACYRLANRVVVLSEPSRDKIRAAFPTLRTPVAVIEHGAFVLPVQSPPPGTGTLLAFGTIRRNKGVLEAIGGVIAARAAGIPVRLIVAGAAHAEDRAYAADCIALARTAPDAVDLRIGFIADEALPALFAQSDALLMPYGEFFSQSGVALLAASNARPVIAAAAGGIGALIAEGMPAVTIAVPVSADDVAAAIRQYVATAPQVWRARAEAYRTVTLERRAWPVIADQYLALARTLRA